MRSVTVMGPWGWPGGSTMEHSCLGSLSGAISSDASSDVCM